MTSASNLSDELSELNFNSAEDLAKEPMFTHFSRYHIYEEDSSQKTIPLSRKYQQINFDIRRSRLLYETPLSVDMQVKYQLIIDKQQALIDLLKKENFTAANTLETITKECEEHKTKLTSLLTQLWGQLGLQGAFTEIDKGFQRIKQSIGDIRAENTQLKERIQSQPVEPPRKDNGRAKPRLEIDVGSPTNAIGKYKQKDDSLFFGPGNGKKPQQTPRSKEEQLLREIEDLREENKKLKSTNTSRPSIPVFVTSPRDRKTEIVVEKIVEREKIVEKPVFVTQIVTKDKTIVVQKIVEKKVPVYIERVKEIPIYKVKEKIVEKIVEKPPKIIEKIIEKPKIIYQTVEIIVEKTIEVPVEKIVQKIVEKIIYIDIATQDQKTNGKQVFLDTPDHAVTPIYIDRDIEVEKIVYITPGGVKLQSRAVQVEGA